MTGKVWHYFSLVLCSDMSWSGPSHGCVDWLEGRGFKIGCLLYHSYCWWFRNPAADEVGSLSHYSRGFIHARWLFGISELSTVCFLIVLKDMPANHVDTVSCKDDFAADVAKLKEEETTSVKQFEAGQLEGISFWRSTRWVQTKLNLLTIVGSQTMCFLSIFFFQTCKFWVERIYTPGSTNIAGWKVDPDWVDVFPIWKWDIPASYVSLPEGSCSTVFWGFFGINPRE